MSIPRPMCLICTPSHPFFCLTKISQTYSSPSILHHFDLHNWQMHSMDQSRKVEAEDAIDELANLSETAQDGSDSLSDLGPIPLQITVYPVISDSSLVPAGPDELSGSSKCLTWLNNVREVEKPRTWLDSSRRPALRRVKSVRRFSVSSNPEVNESDGRLRPPNDERSIMSAAPDEDDDGDSFGLHSRRRSSVGHRLRRRKTSISLMQYSLGIPEIEGETEGNPATWSTCATRANSNVWPESISDDAGSERERQPEGDLRRAAAEGSLQQRRKASLPPFLMWRELVQSNF